MLKAVCFYNFVFNLFGKFSRNKPFFHSTHSNPLNDWQPTDTA